jgi:hypothetical protein
MYMMVKQVKEELPRSRSRRPLQRSLTPRECPSNLTYS